MRAIALIVILIVVSALYGTGNTPQSQSSFPFTKAKAYIDTLSVGAMLISELEGTDIAIKVVNVIGWQYETDHTVALWATIEITSYSITTILEYDFILLNTLEGKKWYFYNKGKPTTCIE
jgi:hypothetical protein